MKAMRDRAKTRGMSELTDHLSVLAEPIRVRLLSALHTEQLAVGELVRVVQLPQSTVSRHLKVLRNSGWVKSRSEGSASFFRMNRDDVEDAATEVWRVVLDDFQKTLQHREDQARLAAVLTERITDSRSFFGKLHRQWDALRDQLYGRDFWLPTLLELLPRGLTVADFGCGTGEALAAMSPVVERAIGVDREPAMIEAAKVRCADLDNVELIAAEMDELPLSDGEIDAALVMLVLHHTDDPASVLAECRRVLTPDGRLVILDMIAHDRADWAESMGHVHLGFSAAQIAELAESAGLTVRSHRLLIPDPEAPGPPLFLAVLAR